ncbi:MAG: hypothetical protein H6Q14_1234 [Bacteroidetes bacterium]|nr:hypothetical protein [Bacteroidota bacterium]
MNCPISILQSAIKSGQLQQGPEQGIEISILQSAIKRVSHASNPFINNISILQSAIKSTVSEELKRIGELFQFYKVRLKAPL